MMWVERSPRPHERERYDHRGTVAFSLVAISFLCIGLTLMSDVGMSEPVEDTVFVDFLNRNATFDPSEPVEAVIFHLDIWSSFNASEAEWFDVILEIDDPEFTKYEFQPGVVRSVDDDPKRVLLKVYPPEGILADVYDLPILAHAFSNNGTYRGQALGNVTIDVLERRYVPIEFIGGNIIPYYPDIPQITHNLLLFNEGNTVEHIFCRYLTNDEDIEVSVCGGSSYHVDPANPVEILPGEYVVLHVVFFIDTIPDENGMIPITMEIVSSEDGQVLFSRNSLVHKLPERDDKEPLDPFCIGLAVATIVLLVLMLFYRQRSRGRTMSDDELRDAKRDTD